MPRAEKGKTRGPPGVYLNEFSRMRGSRACTHTHTSEPTAPPHPNPLAGFSAVTAGYHHTCAIAASGGVKCWGYNGNGQLGIGSYDNQNRPADVAGAASGARRVTLDSSGCEGGIVRIDKGTREDAGVGVKSKRVPGSPGIPSGRRKEGAGGRQWHRHNCPNFDHSQFVWVQS